MIVCFQFVLKIKMENCVNNVELLFPPSAPFHSFLAEQMFSFIKGLQTASEQNALFAYLLHLWFLNHSCVSFLVFFMVQRPPQKYLKRASCRNTVSRKQCNEQACFGTHEVFSSIRIILNKLSDSLKPQPVLCGLVGNCHSEEDTYTKLQVWFEFFFFFT